MQTLDRLRNHLIKRSSLEASPGLAFLGDFSGRIVCELDDINRKFSPAGCVQKATSVDR